MKSLSDYINDLPVEILEKMNRIKSSPEDPPAILVMRRKSIRQLTNGQKVALYYVDKLKKYVTVPYDASGNMTMTVEEFVDEEKSIIQHLQQIVSEQSSNRIYFDDGSNMLIDKFVANDVLRVYEELNDSNKQQMSEMAQKSKNDFRELVEFAKKYRK